MVGSLARAGWLRARLPKPYSHLPRLLAVAVSLTLVGAPQWLAPSVASGTVIPTISPGPDALVGEADGTVSISVRLDQAGSGTVTVQYATVEGTATDLNIHPSSGCGACQYEGVSGQLTFPPGDVQEDVPIAIHDNIAAQRMTSFRLVLSNAVNATIARAQTRISIVDNDTIVATPALLARDAAVDQRDGSVIVPILLGGPRGQVSNSAVTVHYATANGSATAVNDYVPKSGTLTFAPGETVKNVTIDLRNPAGAQPTRRFTLNLSSPTNATILGGQAVVTIGPSGASPVNVPTISAAPDRVVGEADGYIDVPVSLSVPGTQPVTVLYSSRENTATDLAIHPSSGCGACQYYGVSGQLTFAPGETTKLVRIELGDNATAQVMKSFLLVLGDNNGNAVNATIARAQTRISIVDNDTIVATPALLARDAAVDQRDGSVIVPILLGGPRGQVSNSAVTVHYATANGSATAVNDYVPKSGTLTFAPGETVKNVTIDLRNPAGAQPTRRFTLNLSSPTNATILGGQAVVTIGPSGASPVNVPTISAAPDRVVGEADGYIDVPVSLSVPGTQPVTVLYSSRENTATDLAIHPSSGCGACQYYGVSGQLTFAPGETTKLVRIELGDNATAQVMKSFLLVLGDNNGNAVNATIARAQTRISIVDNDTIVATPALLARDAAVDQRDGSVIVPILLGGPRGQVSNSAVTVHYATANGSATAVNDYVPKSGTLTFAPGETVKNVTIDLRNPAGAQPTRRFTLNLSSPTNATILGGQAVVTIGPSGASPVNVPTISAAPDRVVGEADGYIDVPVSLSVPGTQPVTVLYSSRENTATDLAIHPSSGCGACQYYGVSGQLTFAPGETTKLVRIELGDNATAQVMKSFLLVLGDNNGNAVNATIARAQTRISIVDNDTIVATPALLARDAAVDQRDGSVIVPILLGGPRGQVSNSAVTVHYATANGSATAVNDYAAQTGSVTFAPGETVKNVVIDLFRNPSSKGNRRFALRLTNATNATILGGQAVVTIGPSGANPSNLPAISSSSDLTAAETAGYVDVPVSLSVPGTQPVTVDYSSMENTATDLAIHPASGCTGCQYYGVSGELTFAPGETTKLVRIQLGDNSAQQAASRISA